MAVDRAVVSLFTGAFGLDLGLERLGFRSAVCVECDRFAAATIRANRPRVPVIERPVESVTTRELMRAADLASGEAFLVTGGPSCQTFSSAGRRRSVGDRRGRAFEEFVRVVREARPRFFLFENVQGLLSAALRHRPMKKRTSSDAPLRPEERFGSAFAHVLRALASTRYRIVFGVLNAADYGVPQVRRRLIAIGSRDGEPIEMPIPSHGREEGQGRGEWRTLRDGLEGLDDPTPAFLAISRTKLRFVSKIPAGGNWRDLPRTCWADAVGSRLYSWGGHGGYLRRLTWHRPAPTLTARPDSAASLFCHPDLDRPLSVREFARLQQFPDDWVFSGGLVRQYLQVANAVPVGLAEAVGAAILRAARSRRRLPRTLSCDPEMLRKLLSMPSITRNRRGHSGTMSKAPERPRILGRGHVFDFVAEAIAPGSRRRPS